MYKDRFKRSCSIVALDHLFLCLWRATIPQLDLRVQYPLEVNLKIGMDFDSPVSW